MVVSVGALVFAWGWPRPGPARSDDPDPVVESAFHATYKALEGRREFAFSFKDMGVLSHPVGMLNWEVPNTQFSTGGLERHFRTYSCDPLGSVAPGKTYPFKFESITLPTYFGLPNNEAGQAEAARKTKYIKELYGRYYQEAVKEPAELPSAFQAALWELVQESPNPEDGSHEFSLFSGDFRANYRDPNTGPEYVLKAEEYLRSLIGDDKVFIENPAFDSLELVRMTGVPGADGVAPQAQITLRLREGATNTGQFSLNDAGLAGGGVGLGGGGSSAGPGGSGTGRTLVPNTNPPYSGGGGGGGGGFPGVVNPGGGSGGGSNSSSEPPGSGGTGSGSGGGTTPINGGGDGSGSGGSGSGGTGGSGTGGSGSGSGSGGAGGSGSGGSGNNGGNAGEITPVPAPPALILLGVGAAAAWLGRKAVAPKHA